MLGMLLTNTYGWGFWAIRVAMVVSKSAWKAAAEVIGAHQDGHIAGVLADGLGGLAWGVVHLGAADGVVVSVPGDGRVELPDALVVAGDPVVAGIAGGPGLAGVVAIGAADVGGAGDRIPDSGHAGRQRWRRPGRLGDQPGQYHKQCQDHDACYPPHCVPSCCKPSKLG